MRSSNNNQHQQQQQVARPRKYGDIDNSDFVHEEIKELGNQIKAHMKQFEVRDEASLLNNLRMSGPSEQSKAQLRKELEGAQQSIQSGVYYVYRNVAPPKINPRTGKPFMSRQQEECCRLGPSHNCFCGHSLSQHHAVNSGGSGSNTATGQVISRRGGGAMMPPCALCDCSKFVYIPNQPEEVGDGFLSRRKGFVAEAWSAKCKCGCGSKSHDPTTKSCRACRKCYGFEGDFLCGVCDGRWEEHATIMETESDRRSQNLAVGNDYLPLAGVDPEFREIVFGEETAKALPPSSRKQIMGNSTTSGSGSKQLQLQQQTGPMTRAQREHLRDFQSTSSSSASSTSRPTATTTTTNRRAIVEEIQDDDEDDYVRHQQQQSTTAMRRTATTTNAPQQQIQQVSSSSTNDSSSNNAQIAYCPQCNQGNRRLAKFCRACGAKM